MSLLGAYYASSDEDDSQVKKSQPSTSATTLVAAPEVSIDVWSHKSLLHFDGLIFEQDPGRLQLMLAKPTDTTLTYNARYEDISRLTQGPANPYKSTEGNALKRKNGGALTGHAEEVVISDATFSTQHRTFQSLGYSLNPNGSGGIVGDQAIAAQFGGKDVVQLRPSKADIKALKRKRQRRGDASIVDGDGAYKGPWARYVDQDQAYEEEAALAGEELASDEEYIEEGIVATNLPAPSKSSTDYQDESTSAETTVFHGSSEHDYQGRTYMHIPQDLDIDLRKEPGTEKNYIPKKIIHTWKSHTKAINALRFIPNSGHLLLSSSADSKIKLWDCYHDRELLRDYNGHTKSVSDICFNHDGTQFLSASFDRQVGILHIQFEILDLTFFQMKLWDTESGKSISKFSTGKNPHVIKFHPSPSSSHEFVAGIDKKIVQFDTRTGELTQEYGEYFSVHLKIASLTNTFFRRSPSRPR